MHDLDHITKFFKSDTGMVNGGRLLWIDPPVALQDGCISIIHRPQCVSVKDRAGSLFR